MEGAKLRIKAYAALQIDALDLFDKDGLISIDKNSLRADVLERISRAVLLICVFCRAI